MKTTIDAAQSVMSTHPRLRPLTEIEGQCLIDDIDMNASEFELGLSFDVYFTGPGAAITLDLHAGTFCGHLMEPIDVGDNGTYGVGTAFTQDSSEFPWVPALCQFFFRQDPIPLNAKGEPYFTVKGLPHVQIQYTTMPPGTCIHCNGIHASLTSECPRYKITPQQRDAIRDRALDFFDGQWHEFPALDPAPMVEVNRG